MCSCFLKRILPFALALFVGVGLIDFVNFATPRTRSSANNATTQPPSAPLATESAISTPLPEIHVLSVDTISENVVYAAPGKNFKTVQIISPPGVQFTAATVKDYKQSVLQLSVRFGEDGAVSEIVPLKKRADCGDYLPSGKNIIEIDAFAPASRPQVEAATAAVRQIKFTPEQSAGVSVPTHGLVECVFRLAQDALLLSAE